MSNIKDNFDHILALLNISALNEMQLASIEANEKEKDIVLLSATGSGKTLAFLLPLLSRFQPDNKKTQAIIIVKYLKAWAAVLKLPAVMVVIYGKRKRII